MRRDAQAVLLLALAAMLVKLSVTGVADRYVRPGMVGLLLLAAGVLALLGGSTLWRSLRDWRLTRYPDAAGDGASPPADRPASAGWLLVVALVTGLVLVPPALGAYHANRYGTTLASHAPSSFGPLPTSDPIPLTLVEYASRAIVEQGRALSGRRVSLLGFIVTAPDGRPYLARLVVGCCAADARPVKIGLTGDIPPGLVAGEWVRVVGGYAGQVERDPHGRDLIPYVEVFAFEPATRPEPPYEF